MTRWECIAGPYSPKQASWAETALKDATLNGRDAELRTNSDGQLELWQLVQVIRRKIEEVK